MKIPLRVRNRFDQAMPFVSITINYPRIRPVPIDCLVDTGSPWLAIAPKDVLVLNIPVSKLRKAKKYPEVGFAATTFWRYVLPKPSIRLRAENSKVAQIDPPSISVLWPTKGKPQRKRIKSIVSVIGSDFLTFGKLQLHFDPSKRTGFLAKGLNSTQHDDRI